MAWANRRIPNEEQPTVRPVMTILCFTGGSPRFTQPLNQLVTQIRQPPTWMSFENGTSLVMDHEEPPSENPVDPVGPVVTEEESPNEHSTIPEEAASWADGVSTTPEGFIAEGKENWEDHMVYEDAHRMLGSDNTKVWKVSAEAGVAIHIKKLEDGKYSFTYTGTDARIDAAVSMIHHVGS